MIEVRYKCSCLQDERKVMVKERTSGQNVVEWVEEVALVAISCNHAELSPLCVSTRMEYIKIPADEQLPIGVAPPVPSMRH